MKRDKETVYMGYIYAIAEPNTFYTVAQLVDMLHDYTPPGWIRKYGNKRPFLHKHMPCKVQLAKWLRRDSLIISRPSRVLRQKEWCLLLIGPVQQGETHPAHEVNE